MKKTIILSSIILSSIIAINPANAARNKTQQGILEGGTFLGVTLAATVAGGPVGLLVGSASGAFLAKQTRKANNSNLELEQSATKQEEMETVMTTQSARINILEEEATNKLTFQILFSTGNDELSEMDIRRIHTLASYLNNNPNLHISLDGHTDPRGTDEYNNVLSQERAKSIKNALKDLGISEDRITSHGHGSTLSSATKGDLDAYEQERRVEIKINKNQDSPSLAHTH